MQLIIWWRNKNRNGVIKGSKFFVKCECYTNGFIKPNLIFLQKFFCICVTNFVTNPIKNFKVRNFSCRNGKFKLNTRFFFYKQHFLKQRQAEIGKKIKQMQRNSLRLNFCYLKIIHILHRRYHPKIIGHFLKTKQKN